MVIGFAVHEGVMWRAKAAPRWRFILLLVCGLFLLVQDAINAPHLWIEGAVATAICAIAGFYTARHGLRGSPIPSWKVALCVIAALLAIDILIKGGPAPWWQEVSNFLSGLLDSSKRP